MLKLKVDLKQYVPQSERKKIMLMSDDIRFPSGIANISKDIITHTAHIFNWVQLGGSTRHPDVGKVADVSKDINEALGIDDVYCKLYGIEGYGTPDLVRELMTIEQPDVIMHFTDPRFWGWLYDMEHEIRQSTPLIYLNIWDSLPDPQYNQNSYMSCDTLMSISKQTYGINTRVLDRVHRSVVDVNEVTEDSEFDHMLAFLPHGVNDDVFYPITEDKELEEMDKWVKEYFGPTNPIHDSNFIIFWNNRNMRRKQPGDLILSYKKFLQHVESKYGKEVAQNCYLLAHTSPIDDNGTDLIEVCKALLDENDKVQFSTNVLSQEQLNYLYNLADITINITSNEGFGISTCESLSAGTPILANVTGGIQDQCGFKNEIGQYLTVDDYKGNDWGSNHDGRYTTHGEWAKVVYPTNLSLQGAPTTPYIFDDRASYLDIAEKMFEWYETQEDVRRECGLKGREFIQTQNMTSEIQGKTFVDIINKTLKYFKPIKRFEIVNTDIIPETGVLSTVATSLNYKRNDSKIGQI